MLCLWGLLLITYAPRGRGEAKSSIHFHCILHAKRGEEVQISCTIAYVLNGRLLSQNLAPAFWVLHLSTSFILKYIEAQVKIYKVFISGGLIPS